MHGAAEGHAQRASWMRLPWRKCWPKTHVPWATAPRPGPHRCLRHTSLENVAVQYQNARCAAAYRRAAGARNVRALFLVNETSPSGRKKGHSPPVEAEAARRCGPVYRWDFVAAVSSLASRLVALWLLLDRAPAHTDTKTLRLAVE